MSCSGEGIAARVKLATNLRSSAEDFVLPLGVRMFQTVRPADRVSLKLARLAID
jgi:hypothetical protein